MLNIINSHQKSLETLQNYLKGISNRAKRVRIGVTSNIVESFFAVNGKMQHGKVKNLIQRGTFEYRCYAASLLFNNGQNWAFDLASELFNSDGLYFRRQHCAKFMKYTSDRKRKSCTEYKRKRKITKFKKNISSENCTAYGVDNADSVIETDQQIFDLCLVYFKE